VVKDLGGYVLGLAAATGATGDEGVDAIEVPLVQIAEPARVRLRGFDQEPLVVPSQGNLCRRCAWRHRFIPYNGRRRAKVTVP
jgi:hypothetical protein